MAGRRCSALMRDLRPPSLPPVDAHSAVGPLPSLVPGSFAGVAWSTPVEIPWFSTPLRGSQTWALARNDELMDLRQGPHLHVRAGRWLGRARSSGVVDGGSPAAQCRRTDMAWHGAGDCHSGTSGARTANNPCSAASRTLYKYNLMVTHRPGVVPQDIGTLVSILRSLAHRHAP